MNKLLKIGTYMFLAAGLTLGLASCGEDDPEYHEVTPPTVAVNHSVSGRVTAIDGTGIAATITLNNTTVTTNSDGVFFFESVDLGNYTISATAEGKVAKQTTFTITNDGTGQNYVWNVTLENQPQSVTVESNGSVEGDVKSETVKGNEQAEITATVNAEEGAVQSTANDAQIILTPIYNAENEQTSSRAATRATDQTLLIGTEISCTDPNATLAKPINLTYNIDPTVAPTVKAQKLVNGTWVDTECTVAQDGTVTIAADRFTSYALFFNATITTQATTTPVTFQQSEWNNLNGSSSVAVGSASYTYQIGTQISSRGTTRLQAYLIEVLARTAGASATSATGTYPLNVTLPVGTALAISGRQAVTTYTVSALNSSVTGRQYGTVSVTTRTWNRQHTGGSSQPNL